MHTCTHCNIKTRFLFVVTCIFTGDSKEKALPPEQHIRYMKLLDNEAQQQRQRMVDHGEKLQWMYV